VRLHSQAQILEHGETLEQVGDLERARDAERGKRWELSPLIACPA
jgi:hypothetical protein